MAVSMPTPKGAILEDMRGGPSPFPAMYAHWRWIRNVAAQNDDAADPSVIDFATHKLAVLEDEIIDTPAKSLRDMAIKVLVLDCGGDGPSPGALWDRLVAEAAALAGDR